MSDDEVPAEEIAEVEEEVAEMNVLDALKEVSFRGLRWPRLWVGAMYLVPSSSRIPPSI